MNQYDAVISNSLLDTYKLQLEIDRNKKADTLLPKHRDALEVSYQVGTCLPYCPRGHIPGGYMSALEVSYQVGTCLS